LVVNVVLEVEGKGRFENSMSEGSIALGVSKSHHPLDMELVRVVNGVHVTIERLEVHANPPNLDIHYIDMMMFFKGFSHYSS
jgi:hypothetical protein